MSGAVYTARDDYRTIAETLDRVYGVPSRVQLPLGNKRDPLDELIYIMLTVMTEFGVDAVYADLRRNYPSWSDVANATEPAIAAILQPVGLSRQRAVRITGLLREIARREGSYDLRRLDTMDDNRAEAYLTSLPGVGKKVARCVMLYSLGRNVFPVDAHVLRVLTRLGFAALGLTVATAQDELHLRVPELVRYTLHVNLVVHGRTVCRARRPQCSECVLAPRCPQFIASHRSRHDIMSA